MTHPAAADAPRVSLRWTIATWMRFALRVIAPLVLIAWLLPLGLSRLASSAALGRLLEPIGLGDYNTRIVLLGTMLLGAVSGVTGSFALLRRRALIGDVLSHAMLPGICIAFLIMVALGGSGRSMPGLLAGATVTGLIGVGCVLLIRRFSPIKEDAALGIVLSVFFAIGIMILGVILKGSQGHAAGLNSFIYGKTASMVRADAELIATTTVIAGWLCAMLFKEFTLLSFDQDFAQAEGWPRLRLDAVMLALITAVVVVGLQAVGLILVVALLIIPPAAARFWTDRLRPMVALAAGIGATCGFVGAAISARVPDTPAGATIVLVATGLFVLSLLFGRRRGLVHQAIERRRMRRGVARQHLLRAMYESLEPDAAPRRPVTEGALLRRRSWSPAALRGELRRAERDDLIEPRGLDVWALTAHGHEQARRATRNHRLWEHYLITYADIAPSHVDRAADEIEHVIGEAMVRELETRLAAEARDSVPESPHRMPAPTAAEGAS